MKLWPWSRFAELEGRNRELVELCKAIADATNALVVDGNGTVVRNLDFGTRSIYIASSARHTLIEHCLFSGTMEDRP
jgi:hypothetical protein